ncbi:hypothetical protein HD554DRAFT_1069651 [Boletus coccyginus]|nr:hypothetical protein HD554DRAFT_1069651 [Boletus coccyginus]
MYSLHTTSLSRHFSRRVYSSSAILARIGDYQLLTVFAVISFKNVRCLTQGVKRAVVASHGYIVRNNFGVATCSYCVSCFIIYSRIE